MAIVRVAGIAALVIALSGCFKKKDDRAAARLSLGGDHSCATMRDHSIRCWGQGVPGGPLPARIPGVFQKVAVGAAHECAMADDVPRRVACWGPASSAERPTSIELDANAIDLAAGGDTTCARLVDGQVSCWNFPSPRPAKVDGARGALEIAVGEHHACARFDDGTVRCWGKNDHGQLGNAMSGADQDAPAPVVGLTNVTRIASGDAHTCARIGDEAVKCWGANGAGQLGEGTTVDRASPVIAKHITGAVQLSLGGDTSCARMQDASLMCWGSNKDHQLADGSTNDSPEPKIVFGVFDAVEVAVGGGHACVRFKDGRVRCWGRGAQGQLGDGAAVDRAVPVGVKFQAG